MAKIKSEYVCQECGARQPKWLGRCRDCGAWNSFLEERQAQKTHSTRESFGAGEAVSITDVQAKLEGRIELGIEEFDRVLGGGAVWGSAVLVGGEPGIGKSTLMLQGAGGLSQRGKKILYVTGEESNAQIKIRADRLNIGNENLFVLSETNLDSILKTVSQLQPEVIIIDSIQMIFKPSLESAPGSVSQIRECAADLIAMSKKTETLIMIVGHVTKDGVIAGPKILEHMVDTVLYFEGERYHSFRILRCLKNRFGATDEIGIFEMCNTGLESVRNPGALFLENRSPVTTGSVIMATAEGTRTLLIEVQALVTRAVFGTPNRRASGIDSKRMNMLLAVLEKHADLRLHDQDVFINVVGGVRVTEPAADLAIALAVASNFLDRPFPADTIAIGELGLGGEIRKVHMLESRLAEADTLGFKRALLPEGSSSQGKSLAIEIHAVSNLTNAIEYLNQSM